MVATINNTCDTLTITGSTVLTTWMDNTGYTLVLEYRNNCADTYNKYTVLTSNVTGSTPDYTFTISATDLVSSSTFSDGVYTFRFVLTQDNTGDTNEETDCTLANCELECKVIDYQINNPTSLIRMWYDALLSAITCDNCDCTQPCAIWEKIQDILGQTSSDDCQCG